MDRKQFSSLEFITRAVRMPSIPTVFSKVLSLSENPSASLPDIAHVIEEDQAVTARMLRVANSAAYGLQSKVGSVSQACATLGIRQTRNIVLQTSLMENFASIESNGFDLEGFWKHTTLTGMVCRELVEHARFGIDLDPDEAYTCGLLHDIGMVVMVDSYPSAFLQAVEKAREAKVSQEEAETSVFGFTHSEVGAVLTHSWKFPSKIVMVTRWHHTVPRDVPEQKACLLVAAANRITEAAESGLDLHSHMGELFERVERKIGLWPEDFQKAMDRVAEVSPALEL